MLSYDEEMTDKMSKDELKDYKSYANKCRAENDLSLLLRAREIKIDDERMEMVKICARKKKESLGSLISGE